MSASFDVRPTVRRSADAVAADADVDVVVGDVAVAAAGHFVAVHAPR